MGFLNNLLVILGVKSQTPQTTPQAGTPANQTGTQPSTDPNAAPVAAQKKVIIIEDDVLLSNALELKLKHENFAVVKAANGQIGLEMIQKEKPNMVLLDLMMPVMDGKTMLHKLREIEEFKFLPVIVLTNAGDVDSMKETKRYDNASAFLIKSNINPEDVVTAIREFI